MSIKRDGSYPRAGSLMAKKYVVSLALALGLTFTIATTFAQSPHTLVPADKVQWGPAPPVLPAGAQISVLEGNPSEKGAVTLRLRFPPATASRRTGTA